MDGLIIPNLYDYVKRKNIKIDQGLWIGDFGANEVDPQLDRILEYAKGDFRIFNSFIIGNEPILMHKTNRKELLEKVAQVKKKLVEAGFKGTISIAEVRNTFEADPELCKDANIDYVSLNAHPYFAGIPPAEAGAWILKEREAVKKICQKPVYIAETGYPNKGMKLGDSDPTRPNQILVLNLMLNALHGEATLMDPYNTPWKKLDQYGIERSFGIWPELA